MEVWLMTHLQSGDIEATTDPDQYERELWFRKEINIQPLDISEITKLPEFTHCANSMGWHAPFLINFARAVERAHGIQ